MLMLYFFFISKGKKIILVIDTQYCLSLLKNAWPLAITTAFYVIYSKIDQVIIGHMLNNNQTGLYAAGVRLAEIWYFIPSMIMGIIFPSLVEAKKRNRDLFNLRIKKVSFFILAISLAFSLIQFLTADFIVKILFGQKYTDSITVLQIYTWAISILVLINIIQQYLTITNRLKTIMFASIFGAAVNVLLNLYLIPIYGINGSAFATLISYFTIPIFIVIFNKKHED